MLYFTKNFVVPLLKRRKWTRVCEIGASFGGSTDLLAEVPNAVVTVIDPCLDCSLTEKYAQRHLSVRVKQGTSLEILPTLHDAYDCIIIDGDHNWYTVYHELKLISERNLLSKGGIVFFHDTEWPWARRDMYYQPELIPEEYRHDMDEKVQGGIPNDDGSYREYTKATHEGGARNGVLTAIEDFLQEQQDRYIFSKVLSHGGMGIMYHRKSFADDLSFLAIQGKVASHNAAVRSMRFARTHFHLKSTAPGSLSGRA